MNKVLLTGRLTRDPEMRSLASGKNVTTFTVASNEFIGGGREKAEYQRKGKVYLSRRSAFGVPSGGMSILITLGKSAGANSELG